MRVSLLTLNTVPFFFCIGLVVVGPHVALAQGRWFTAEELSAPRDHVMAESVGPLLYLIGGNWPAFVASVEVFDTRTGVWSTKSPMSEGRGGGGSAAIAGKIYVVGGASTSRPGIETLEVYDPNKDTWKTRAPMPTPRRHPAVEAVNGRLYVIGGVNEELGGSLRTVEVYDPAADRWSRAAPLPSGRDSMTSGVMGSLIIVAGGLNDAREPLKSAMLYDTKADRWHSLGAMPVPHAYGAGGVIGGRFYVATGIIDLDETLTTRMEVFDPILKSWSAAPAIPTPRNRLGESAAVKSRLYVAGGWFPCFACPIATVEAFQTPKVSPQERLRALLGATPRHLKWASPLRAQLRNALRFLSVNRTFAACRALNRSVRSLKHFDGLDQAIARFTIADVLAILHCEARVSP